MASSEQDHIAHDFPPFFRVFKDGRVERYMVQPNLPPGHDPKTGVTTKDVQISPETGLSARLFVPRFNGPDEKLPLFIHYHGGGFCVGSPFDIVSNNYLSALVAKAHVIAMSVDFRLAPDHLLPIAYEDSFAALQWVASHSGGTGPEPIINQNVDMDKIILGGESAGANIAHHVAVRAGSTGLEGARIDGVVIVHPFFGNTGGEDLMYKYMCPTSSGRDDDPKLNPGADPDLSKMAGSRVLVCLAEKDGLRERGCKYYETVGKSGWRGEMELYESFGEDHCFHLFGKSEKATELIDRLVSFIKHQKWT